MGHNEGDDVLLLGEGENLEQGGVDVVGLGDALAVHREVVPGVEHQRVAAVLADLVLGDGQDAVEVVGVGVDEMHGIHHALLGLLVEVGVDALAVEVLAGELADEHSHVEREGHHFGAEHRETPAVVVVHLLGHLVEELRLAAAGGAGDDDQTAFFEAHELIEIGETNLHAFGQSVGVEVVEVEAEAFHIGVAFGSDGAALVEFLAQGVGAAVHQAVVGILAGGAVGLGAVVGDDDVAAGVEVLLQLAAEVGAHGVVVGADVDGLLVGKILLIVVHEPVHRLVAAAVGDGDDVGVADFGQRESVHLALDDVAVLGVEDAVEVVAYLFAVSLGLTEALVAGAELGGDEFAVAVVVEVYGGAVAAFGQTVAVAGGHPVGAVGDAHLFECRLADATALEPGHGLGVHLARAGFGRAVVGAFGLLGLTLGVVAEPRLLAHPRLLLLIVQDGGVAVPSAVVAAEVTRLEVAGEAFISSPFSVVITPSTHNGF